MFRYHYPMFKKGRILKRDMLEDLRDFPREVTDLFYHNYSDGVITGANIVVNENANRFVVTKGIVKFQGKLYVLREDTEIAYFSTGKDTLVKLRFTEVASSLDFVEGLADIVLDESVDIGENEMELARYKLKIGAYLRSDYQDLADFNTEYNTVNIIHVAYSGEREKTVHPDFLRYFAREILKNGAQNPYDIAFSFQCLNERVVNRELICAYLANRSKQASELYSNEEIHRALVQIALDAIHHAGSGRSVRNGVRKILVD